MPAREEREDDPPGDYMDALVEKLRRRRFALSPEDITAVRDALRAGFGWRTPEDLCRLLCLLWAKSYEEQATLRSLFQQTLAEWEIPAWSMTPRQEPLLTDRTKTPESTNDNFTPRPIVAPGEDDRGAPPPAGLEAGRENLPAHGLATAPQARSGGGVGGDGRQGRTPGLLDPLQAPVPAPTRRPARTFIFSPAFPLSEREIAQTWRRLRLSEWRGGPATEPDIPETIREITRRGGLATPVVLQPRPRNTLRLLLLLDRGGSMDSFHPWSEYVANAIGSLSRLGNAHRAYFHDTPAIMPAASPAHPASDPAEEMARETDWAARLRPPLDDVLPFIEPAALDRTLLFRDPQLHEPVTLAQILEDNDPFDGVVFLGDAGAVRGGYSGRRVVDTLSLLRRFREGDRALSEMPTTGISTPVVWLNPVPASRWRGRIGTSCGEIELRVPMFPMTRDGLEGAVACLRRGGGLGASYDGGR